MEFLYSSRALDPIKKFPEDELPKNVDHNRIGYFKRICSLFHILLL